MSQPCSSCASASLSSCEHCPWGGRESPGGRRAAGHRIPERRAGGSWVGPEPEARVGRASMARGESGWTESLSDLFTQTEILEKESVEG